MPETAEAPVDAVALYFKRRAEAAEADGLAMSIALRDAERKNAQLVGIVETLRAELKARAATDITADKIEAGRVEAKSKPKN